MVSLIICTISVLVFIAGYRMVKRGSPYRRIGGDLYTKKRARKTMGQLLLTAAGILMVLGLINQFYSLAPAPPDLSDISTTTNAPVHHIPVAPPSPDFVNALTIPPPAPIDKTRVKPAYLYTPGDTPNGNSAGTEQISNPSLGTPAWSPSDTKPSPGTQGAPTAGLAKTESIPTDAAAFSKGLTKEQQLDAQLQAANAAIQKDPTVPNGYIMRANVYALQRKWSMAQAEYHHALQIDSKSVPALFNLAETNFMQNQFDQARAGFLPLVKDPDFGDLAQYKVFLCDLMGGHEDVAAKELDAFNQVGSNASYYFANVAWSLYHKKKDDARDWMASAVNIFTPQKTRMYATALVDLGLLPTTPDKN